MEFYQNTNISIRKSLYSKFDSNLDSLSSILLKSSGGVSGRKISQEFQKCDKVCNLVIRSVLNAHRRRMFPLFWLV